MSDTVNDLMVLVPALSTALRDPDNETWTADELTDIVTWSVARLWPHCSRPLDPTDTDYQITLVADTYFYDIHEDYLAVSRVDLVDTGGNEHGPLHGRGWEIVGDIEAGTAKLHVSPITVETFEGDTLRLIGYGPYLIDPPDGSTGTIPDRLVPLVLAMARTEAYRRVASDRSRFQAWLSRNQSQNMSVNELVTLINEADAEAIRLWRGVRTFQKPVSGRVN